MKLKNLMLVAILSIGTTSVLMPETTYAHGGSKKTCKVDYYGDPDGCKHKGFEKRRKDSKCHRHDYDMQKGWTKNEGIFGISGFRDCKKT